jgi:pimeloyl-ACP methyl ester carboxylesterase
LRYDGAALLFRLRNRMKSSRLRSITHWTGRVLGAGLTSMLATLVCAAQPKIETQPAPVSSTSIDVPFKSHDGYEMLGRLTVPNTKGRHSVIIYVQTAEGATIDQRRPNGRGGTFDYFDLYRQKLPPLDVAFFSYEGRGIRMGDSPPRYEKIDWDIFNTSTLENKVRDILTAVAVVRKQRGVDPSRIFLLGTSEGTLLASKAAVRAPSEIRGLILYAISSGTLKDALRYMTADGAFLAIRRFFDANKDATITKAEYEADPRKYRERILKNTSFDVFDANRDGVFTAEDMRILRKGNLEAVETANYSAMYEWLKVTAAATIPKGWLEDHYAQPPIWTYLSQLKMPVGLFHGSGDNLTPIEGVRKLEELAKKSGKTNLTFHYFDDLDHSLNIGIYFVTGKLPEGHAGIFDYVDKNVRKPK